MRSVGIGPLIGERSEACASLADCVEGVEQVPGRSRQPIQLANHQRVAFAQCRYGLRKLWSITVRARDLLSVDPGATGAVERFSLCSQRLAIRTHPCISNRCHLIAPIRA